LTGNPDAKTRATAIQALTEMGERGACFEEEVKGGKGNDWTLEVRYRMFVDV